MRAFDQRTTGAVEADLMATLRHHRASATAEMAPAAPLKVQIQTWTRCNAACAMCPYPEIIGAPGFVHQQMSEALYRRLLDQLSGLPIERLSPFLMNEPLLDKRLPRWIQLARAALPATTLGIFTNGSALTPALAERLAEAGLDELCVSVHGFDPAVNHRVMGGLDHRRVVESLRQIVPLLAGDRLGGMRVQIVTGDVPEITDTLQLAPPSLRPLIALKAFSNERAVSQVPLDLGSSAHEAVGERAPICQRPFVKLYVMANGDCVACNCDWRRREVLGNAEEQDLLEIWQGARYRGLRRAQIEGRFPEDHVCRGCDYPAVADLS